MTLKKLHYDFKVVWKKKFEVVKFLQLQWKKKKSFITQSMTFN